MKNQRGFAPIVLLLVVTGLLLAGGVWYYEIHHSETTGSSPSASLANLQPAPITEDAFTFFRAYRTFDPPNEVNFEWNLAKVANGVPTDFSVDCVPGVTLFDVVANQPFSCGEANRAGQDMGAYQIYVTNQTGAPVVIQGRLAYGTYFLLATTTINQAPAPSSTGSRIPSVVLTINGSTGPINAAEGATLNESWSSNAVVNCTAFDSDASHTFADAMDVPLSGTGTVTVTPVGHPYTYAHGVECMTPAGSVVSSSVQINASPTTVTVIPTQSFPSPNRMSANGKHQLLASFDIAAGPNPVTITNISLGASSDVASGAFGLSNLQADIVSQRFLGGTLFTYAGRIIPTSIGPNFLRGSFALAANASATIRVYGDVSGAMPGTYHTPFTILGIEGNAGNPSETLFVYDPKVSGDISGQDIVVVN